VRSGICRLGFATPVGARETIVVAMTGPTPTLTTKRVGSDWSPATDARRAAVVDGRQGQLKRYAQTHFRTSVFPAEGVFARHVASRSADRGVATSNFAYLEPRLRLRHSIFRNIQIAAENGRRGSPRTGWQAVARMLREVESPGSATRSAVVCVTPRT